MQGDDETPDIDEPIEEHEPEDIELEPGEEAVIEDRGVSPLGSPVGEHPDHPEVAGQPDPNG